VIVTDKKFRIKLVMTLFACMFIMGLDRSSLGIAAPVIMKDLNINPAAMGIALSAFFLTYTIFNLPGGNLADKFGSKPVLGWAVAIWSLASAATGLVTGLVGIMAARLGVGAGEAAVFPVNAKIAADNFPAKERATAIGWYLSGARLGYAATPIIMGYLIVHYSWRLAFVITGMGSLLWCVFWYYMYKDPGNPLEAPSHQQMQSGFICDQILRGLFVLHVFDLGAIIPSYGKRIFNS